VIVIDEFVHELSEKELQPVQFVGSRFVTLVAGKAVTLEELFFSKTPDPSDYDFDVDEMPEPDIVIGQ